MPLDIRKAIEEAQKAMGSKTPDVDKLTSSAKDLTESIADAVKEAAKLAQELDALSKIKSGSKSEDFAEMYDELKDLNKLIKEARSVFKDIEKTFSSLSKSTDDASQSISKTAKSIENLEDAAAAANLVLNELGSSSGKAAKNLTDIDKKAKGTADSLEKIAKSSSAASGSIGSIKPPEDISKSLQGIINAVDAIQTANKNLWELIETVELLCVALECVDKFSEVINNIAKAGENAGSLEGVAIAVEKTADATEKAADVLDDFEKSINGVDNALDRLDSKLDPKNPVKFEAAIKAVDQSMANLEIQMNETQRQIEKVSAKMAAFKPEDQGSEEYKKLATELENLNNRADIAKSKMDEMKSALIDIGNEAEETGTSMRGLGVQLDAEQWNAITKACRGQAAALADIKIKLIDSQENYKRNSAALTAANKALKEGTGNTSENVKAIKELEVEQSRLSQEIEESYDKLRTFNETTEDIVDGAERSRRSIGSLSDMIWRVKSAMSKTRSELTETDWKNFADATGSAESKVESFRKSFNELEEAIEKQRVLIVDTYSEIQNYQIELDKLNKTKEDGITLTEQESVRMTELEKAIGISNKQLSEAIDKSESLGKKAEGIKALVDAGEEYAESTKNVSEAIRALGKGLKEANFEEAAKSGLIAADKLAKVRDEYFENKKALQSLTQEFRDFDEQVKKSGDIQKNTQKKVEDQKKVLDDLKKKYEEEIKERKASAAATEFQIRSAESYLSILEEESKATEANTKAIIAQRDKKLDLIKVKQEDNRTTEEAVESAASFTQSLDELSKRTSFFGKVAQESKEEASSFMGGMGGEATGVTALGVALIFAASKLKEIGGELVETQKKWAEYGAEISRAQHIIELGGFEDINLKDLRNELSLTAEQARDLGNVMAREMPSGVIGVEGMVEAARKLEKTFGDDPTKRLREYVELLKEIPTLDTDLNITASLDDQAASWFALAKKGKVQQVVEMQIAGLAGAEQGKVPEGSEAEVETLRETRRGATAAENIGKILADMSPKWLGMSTQIVGQTISTVSTLVSIYMANKAIKNILSRMDKRQEDTKGGISSLIGKKGAGTTTRIGAPAIGGSGPAGKSMGLAAKAAEGLASGASKALGAISLLGSVASAAAIPLGLYMAFGETVGQKMKDLGESSGSLGPGLWLLGDAIDKTGRGLNEMYDYAVEWLTKSNKQLEAEKEERGAKIAALNATNALNEEMRATQQSALALQDVVQGMEAAFNNQKKSLYDTTMQAGLLSMEFQQIAGGSAEQFNSSIQQAAEGLTKGFEISRKASEKYYKVIIHNTKLEPAMRKAALMELKKKEMEAAKAFAEGISQLVQKMLRTPDMAMNEVKNRIKTAEVDIQVTAQAGAYEDILEAGAERVSLTLANMADVGSKFTAVMDVANKANEEAQKKQKDMAVGAAEDVGRLSEELEKIGDGYEFAGRELNDNLKNMYDETGNVTESGLKKVTEGVTDMRKRLQDTLAARTGFSDLFDDSEIRTLAKQQDVSIVKLKEAQNKKAKADKAATSELGGPGAGAGAGKEHLTDKGFEESEIKVKEDKQKAAVELEKAEQEYNNIQARLAASNEDAVNWARKNVDKIAERLNLSTKERQAIMSDDGAALKAARDTVAILRKTTPEVEKSLILNETALNSLEDAAAAGKRQTIAWEQMAVFLEETKKQQDKYMSELDSMVANIEKDPTTQVMKRRQKTLEVQAEIAEKMGTSASAELDLMQQNMDISERQMKNAEKTKQMLEKLVSSGDSSKAVEKLGETFNEAFSKLNTDIANLPKSVDTSGFMVASQMFKNAQQDYAEKMQAAAKSPEDKKARAAADEAAENLKSTRKEFFDNLTKIGASAKEKGIKFDTDLIFKEFTTIGGLMTTAAVGGAQKALDDVSTLFSQSGKDWLAELDRPISAIAKIDYGPIVKAANATNEMSTAAIAAAMQTGNMAQINAAVGASMAANAKIMDVYNKSLIESKKSLAAMEQQLSTMADTDPRKAILAQKTEELRATIIMTAAEKEKTYRENILSLVKAEYDFKHQTVELAQEELDIMKDLAEATGANYDIVRKLQIQDVNLAAQKAAIAKDEYEMAKISNVPFLEQERLRLSYVKAEAEVTKKAMGAQRDAFDKLMEKAFGAIRSARGGKKGIMSNALMFGGGKGGLTYDSSGKVTGTGAKTMEQRQGENILGTVGAGRGGTAATGPKTAADKMESSADKNVKASETILSAAEIMRLNNRGMSGTVNDMGNNVKQQDLTATKNGDMLGRAIGGSGNKEEKNALNSIEQNTAKTADQTAAAPAAGTATNAVDEKGNRLSEEQIAEQNKQNKLTVTQTKQDKKYAVADQRQKTKNDKATLNNMIEQQRLTEASLKAEKENEKKPAIVKAVDKMVGSMDNMLTGAFKTKEPGAGTVLAPEKTQSEKLAKLYEEGKAQEKKDRIESEKERVAELKKAQEKATKDLQDGANRQREQAAKTTQAVVETNQSVKNTGKDVVQATENAATAPSKGDRVAESQLAEQKKQNTTAVAQTKQDKKDSDNAIKQKAKSDSETLKRMVEQQRHLENVVKRKEKFKEDVAPMVDKMVGGMDNMLTSAFIKPKPGAGTVLDPKKEKAALAKESAAAIASLSGMLGEKKPGEDTVLAPKKDDKTTLSKESAAELAKLYKESQASETKDRMASEKERVAELKKAQEQAFKDIQAGHEKFARDKFVNSAKETAKGVADGFGVVADAITSPLKGFLTKASTPADTETKPEEKIKAPETARDRLNRAKSMKPPEDLAARREHAATIDRLQKIADAEDAQSSSTEKLNQTTKDGAQKTEAATQTVAQNVQGVKQETAQAAATQATAPQETAQATANATEAAKPSEPRQATLEPGAVGVDVGMNREGKKEDEFAKAVEAFSKAVEKFSSGANAVSGFGRASTPAPVISLDPVTKGLGDILSSGKEGIVTITGGIDKVNGSLSQISSQISEIITAVQSFSKMMEPVADNTTDTTANIQQGGEKAARDDFLAAWDKSRMEESKADTAPYGAAAMAMAPGMTGASPYAAAMPLAATPTNETSERPPETSPTAAPTADAGGGNLNVTVSGTLTTDDRMFQAKVEQAAATSMRGGILRQISDSRYVQKT